MKIKVVIKESTNKYKKFMAIFTGVNFKKTVHFGGRNYSDFTINKDPKRKQLYIIRHKKRENWNNPMTPGTLSRFLLWGKPTLQASIADYKKHFGFL